MWLRPLPLLLTFLDGDHERDYRLYVTEQRCLGHSDFILFSLSAFFVAVNIPRLVRAGHVEYLPMCALMVAFCAALALIHTPLFLRRPELAAVVRSLRVPLHLLAQLALHLFFLRVVTLPGMVACTGARPATELSTLWLLWLGAYPALASLPLVAAAPLQAFIAATTLGDVPQLCRQGCEACPAGPTMYRGLYAALSTASALLPIPPLPGGGGAAGAETACAAVLEFAIVGTLAPLFWLATSWSETRLRAQYALQRGDALTALDLAWRVPTVRVAVLLGLALAMLWRVLEAAHAL